MTTLEPTMTLTLASEISTALQQNVTESNVFKTESSPIHKTQFSPHKRRYPHRTINAGNDIYLLQKFLR